MESKEDKISRRRLGIQIHDIELLYDALTKYYWKGSILVYSSFTTLPRGRFVPDNKRIVLKEESYDVERGGQRYPLRLLVKTPEQSLLAQNSRYPDTQTTFFIYPDVDDTACVLLFYLFTSEQDRKVSCPYSAGSSVLLMSTELSQVLEQEHNAAIQVIIQELFLSLPMHRSGFRKMGQRQIHGFVIMRESGHPKDPDETMVCYWGTTGLQSAVQLTTNMSLATSFRVSSACDDDPVKEERQAEYLVRSASLSLRGAREARGLETRDSQLSIKPCPAPPDLRQQSPSSSLPAQPYPSAITPIPYSVFIRDSACIWAALDQYLQGLGRGQYRTYSISSTPLPYYPPQGEASSQQLQVPLESRRSLRVRAHNEAGEGFPNLIFVNQSMTLASDKTPPLFQSIYLLELRETSQAALLCYASTSGRQLMLPSYQEETKGQLKMTASENLASLLDRDDTEQAVQLLVDRVFPRLLPQTGLDSFLFQIQGPHDQFTIFKPIPPKHYYWKIRSEAGAVNMTINSTEAAIFQLNPTSS